MKTRNLIIASIILACIVSPLLAKGPKGPNVPPSVTLSDAEIEHLTLLREEEKLARDVYLALFDVWNAQIFANISVSEQRHMDSVKGLIDKYGMEDPVVDDTPGAFTSTVFAELYVSLVTKGSQSLLDALEVGVIIEELDIHDIEEMLNDPDVTKLDVRRVLANLLAGSYNHLDAFNKQILLQTATE